MTNPTSNYGFVLPTSSDLVTDLPADFDVALQGVDTRLKALQPGTTLGDLAYSSATANTNTRLPIGTTGQVLSVVGGVPAWTTGTTGDIEGVTAGVGISGGGTSGTVTVTNSMATAITTAGDLIKGTGSGTFDRLGIGSTGQVLTVSGGVPTWSTPASGSMTLLSTTTLTGSSVTISSISGSYKNLYVEYEGVYCSATASMRLRPNNVSSGIYYDTTKSNQTSALATSTSVSLALDIPSTSGTQNWGYFYINDYADSDHWKFIDNYSLVESTDGATYVRVFPSYGYWRATTAITSLTFLLSTGTFSGGSVRVYGVN